MSLVKSEGIVLKGIKYGDTSMIFSLYTRDFGKIKLLAKGIKNKRSRIAPLGVFSLAEIVCYRKERNELQLLSSAESLKNFPGLSKSINRFSWASALTELLEQLIKGEEPNQRIFNLSLKVLSQMEKTDEMNLEKLFWVFALKLLSHLGYKPRLDVCVGCGKEIKGKEVFLSPERGGIICPVCTREGEYYLKLSRRSYLSVRKLLSLDIRAVDKYLVDKENLDEIGEMVNSFINYHIGTRNLKSLEFLRKVSI
ncbi:MAG: DNA repair protein RecO [candidate division Zixibacteria bacterium]|nr:DNA repair protein RecO [candidate division Zixibacteria bacterium]